MNFIFIFFIIIILIYIFSIKNNYSENFENIYFIPQFREPKVAVVGNGPITEADRQLINNFDIVYRFNDCKNMKKGDKITHLVVRQTFIFHTVTGLDTNFLPLKDAKNIIFIGKDKELYENIKLKNPNRNFSMIDVYEKITCKFMNCNKKLIDNIKFNNINIKQTDASWGPSSGFLVLADVTGKYNNVHIFGMNWNFNWYMDHDSSWEKDNILKLCKHCVIHKTKNDNYK